MRRLQDFFKQSTRYVLGMLLAATSGTGTRINFNTTALSQDPTFHFHRAATEALNASVDVAGQVAWGVGETLAYPYQKIYNFNFPAFFKTRNFDFGDDVTAGHLRKMLAAAAEDVYFEVTSDVYRGSPPQFELKQSQLQGNHEEHVQWGLYETSSHHSIPEKLRNKKILAYRGTKSWADAKSNFSLMGFLRTGQFGRVVDEAERVAKDKRPDFVTGHSLGGAVAEVVALRLHITGASFNGPTVCSSNEALNMCPRLSHLGGHQFEIWLTEEDSISSHSAINGFTKDMHVNTPRFVKCPRKRQREMLCKAPLPAHGMECMIKQEQIGLLEGSSLLGDAPECKLL